MIAIKLAIVILISSLCWVSSAQNATTPKNRPATQATKVREFDLEYAITIQTGNPESDKAVPFEPVDLPFTLPILKYTLPVSIKNMVMFAVKTNSAKSSELRDEYKQVYTNKKILIDWLSIALVDAWNYENASEKLRIDQASANGDIARVLIGYSNIPRNVKSMYAWQDYIINGW